MGPAVDERHIMMWWTAAPCFIGSSMCSSIDCSSETRKARQQLCQPCMILRYCSFNCLCEMCLVSPLWVVRYGYRNCMQNACQIAYNITDLA